MERSPQAQEIRRRIGWFIRLRWVAIAGLLAATSASWFLFRIRFAYLPVALLTVWLVAYNVAFLELARRSPDGRRSALLLIARVQVLLDLLTLVLLLYFTGGFENPFSFYLVFHTAIAGIILPGRESFRTTTLSVVLYAAMVGLDYFGAIPHFPLQGFQVAPFFRDGRYILTQLFAFSTTLYIVSYFTTSLSQRLNERTEQLLAANRKLREADEVRVKAVLTVTHELRAPLASIQTLLSAVLGGHVPGGIQGEGSRTFITRASERVTDLILLASDLLDLHRMELGGVRLELAPLPMGPAITAAVDELRSLARQQRVSLEVSVPEALPPVLADQRSVRSILTNLIANGIKYNVPDGHVTVRAQRLDGFLHVTVADTGVGIPADDLSRVFDIFYQGSYARKQKRMGVGLGLSLVRGLVDAHGGTIRVESEQGRGSSFTFTLPFAPAAIQ